MIRPLTNEDNLQNLEEMDLSEMRADFVEQVIDLRRKVLGRVKIKCLKERALSGEMLVALSTTYVDSINEGAVPNIESAWTYICQNECQKAFENSLKTFDDAI